MIVIYPDTNAMHADLLMRRKVSKELVELLSLNIVEVRLSPVVVEEAKRQVRENAEAASTAIAVTIDKARRAYVLTDEPINELLSVISRQIADEGERALQPLLSHAACETLPWPEVTSRELVERELERIKPVLEKGGQSVGLRDTIIWHGLLDLLGDLEAEDYVIFVTADGGFVDGGELHDELLDEIDGSWLDPLRLRVATSLASATLEAKQLADLISERDNIVGNAFIRYIEALDGAEWNSYGLRHLDVRDASLPYGLEDAVIDSIDLIEVDEIGDGNPAECVGCADFSIRGRMRSADFMDADHSNLDMLFGDIDGFEVTVKFNARATVISEVEYELETQDASVVGAWLFWR